MPAFGVVRDFEENVELEYIPFRWSLGVQNVCVSQITRGV